MAAESHLARGNRRCASGMAVAVPFTRSLTMPTTDRPRASGRVPDGIIAAALACAIAGAGGQGIRAYVRHLADGHLSLITARDVPFKYQTFTLQRAALASGHVLPIYGSSELF